MFGSIGMPELIIILVIALIIFGPRKLPELGKSLGRSLNEFKRASTDLQNTLEQEIRLEEQKETAGQGRGRRADAVRPTPRPARPERGDAVSRSADAPPVTGDATRLDGTRSVSRRRLRPNPSPTSDVTPVHA